MYDIAATSTLDVWVFGDMRVSRSSNGGQNGTWTSQAFPSIDRSKIVLVGINGWAVGRNKYNPGSMEVFHTSNNGVDGWPHQYEFSNETLAPQDMAFSDASHGYIVCDYGKMKFTSDGGMNWSNISIPTTENLMGIILLSSSDIWVVGALYNAILHSTNGGGSWESTYIPWSGVIESVSFVDPTHGWAAGHYGKIFKYSP